MAVDASMLERGIAFDLIVDMERPPSNIDFASQKSFG
jgi:hypothetical protein